MRLWSLCVPTCHLVHVCLCVSEYIRAHVSMCAHDGEDVERDSFPLMFVVGLVSTKSSAKSFCLFSHLYPHNDTVRLVLL